MLLPSCKKEEPVAPITPTPTQPSITRHLTLQAAPSTDFYIDGVEPAIWNNVLVAQGDHVSITAHPLTVSNPPGGPSNTWLMDQLDLVLIETLETSDSAWFNVLLNIHYYDGQSIDGMQLHWELDVP